MNILYFGYRSWSKEILLGILDNTQSNYSISSVFTIKTPEVDFSDIGIPVHVIDPKRLDTASILKLIAKKKPDILLFYGWSWMIPASLHEKYLCLILHPSPLPKYRGGSPLQHQIIRGETKSAITLIKATDEVDSGPMYAQASISLSGTLEDIFQRIIKQGITETKKVIEGYAKKSLKPVKQRESEMTYYKRRKPSESELTFHDLQTKSAVEIYNFVRALSDPYPNAFIRCSDGKKLYLKSVEIEKGK